MARVTWKQCTASSEKYLGTESPFPGPALATVTIALLWIAYRLSKKALRAHKPENIQNLLLIYRYVWWVTGFVVALVALSGKLTALGLSAAFVGMAYGQNTRPTRK